MTKIGILSDTHGLLDERVFEHFRDVDQIWHAGDIGRTDVLEKLRAFKPTRAVKGNIDSGDLQYMLREYDRWRVEDVNVLMTHIGYTHGMLNPAVQYLLNREPAQLFVCGHSHILRVRYDNPNRMLCVNPGAAGKYGIQTVQTLLRLTIDGPEIRDLEVIELAPR